MTIIDKLERADGPDRAMDFLIAIETDWRWPEWEEGEPTIKRLAEKHGLAWALSNDRRQSIWCGIPKFSGSIDAAMTLLPVNAEWTLSVVAYEPCLVTISSGDDRKDAIHALAKTPALALCIAALRARSQGGE